MNSKYLVFTASFQPSKTMGHHYLIFTTKIQCLFKNEIEGLKQGTRLYEKHCFDYKEKRYVYSKDFHALVV